MNPLDVLRPNYMGDSLNNRGVDGLGQNYGYGVREAMATNSEGLPQKEDTGTSEGMKDKLRVAKAREFGKTKETVGF